MPLCKLQLHYYGILQLALYIDGYEHEAIQNPISEIIGAKKLLIRDHVVATCNEYA